MGSFTQAATSTSAALLDRGAELVQFASKLLTHRRERLGLFFVDVVLHRGLQLLEETGDVTGVSPDLVDEFLGVVVFRFGVLLEFLIDLCQAGYTISSSTVVWISNSRQICSTVASSCVALYWLNSPSTVRWSCCSSSVTSMLCSFSCWVPGFTHGATALTLVGARTRSCGRERAMLEISTCWYWIATVCDGTAAKEQEGLP